MAGRLIALIIVLLALVLVALAGPRTLAALAKLHGNTAVLRLQAGLPIDRDGYRAAVASRLAAMRHVDDPGLWSEVGLAHLAALQVEPPAAADSLLAKARDALHHSLSLDPAEPFVWSDLAYVETLAGNRAAAARALDHSLRFGSYLPELTLARAAIGLVNWPWLDTRLRQRLTIEIHVAARRGPDEIAALAMATGSWPLILKLLEDWPHLRRRVEEQMAMAMAAPVPPRPAPSGCVGTTAPRCPGIRP